MRPRTLAAALVLLGTASLAQVPVSRWGSYNMLGPERIDRSNLNLHLEFPLFNRQTVGGAQVNLHLTYDSNFWLAGSSWSPATGAGWLLVTPTGQTTQTTTANYGVCGWVDPFGDGSDDGSGSTYETDYGFTEPDGTPTRVTITYLEVDQGGGRHDESWWNDCPSPTNYTQQQTLPDGKGYRQGLTLTSSRRAKTGTG